MSEAMPLPEPFATFEFDCYSRFTLVASDASELFSLTVGSNEAFWFECLDAFLGPIYFSCDPTEIDRSLYPPHVLIEIEREGFRAYWIPKDELSKKLDEALERINL